MPPSDERGRELQDVIRTIAEERREAVEALRLVEERFARALLAAHDEGLSWSAVAEAAGLATAENARERAQRVMSEEELSPSRRRAGGQPNGDARPGLGVYEAAKVLGVSPSTVYSRIDRGELDTVTDPLGRTRVILDD